MTGSCAFGHAPERLHVGTLAEEVNGHDRRVRSVILLSTWSESRLYVAASMSAKTGRAPLRQTAPAVAKKVKGG